MQQTIDQLSIFLENKTGRLHEITQILADEGISIDTINLVEAGDFGILRMIVADAAATKALLESRGISVKVTPVIVVEIQDKVGCFNRVVSLLKGIDIHYTYTINSHQSGAFVIKVTESDIKDTVRRLVSDGVVVKDAL